MRFSGRGMLLDIEGTTSSVNFVYDVMFPYVRKHLTFEVFANWLEPEYIEAFHAMMIIIFAALPLVLLLRRPQTRRPAHMEAG